MAPSRESALEQVERTSPDVLVVDLALPGIRGIELIREVRARWPGVEVLVFTLLDDEDRVLDAVRAGASGCLLEGATRERLVEAISEVKAGGTVIQPKLARRLLRAFRAERPLTDRETEILQLVARGVSNTEAARMLGLSRATIRTHLEHIYQKLEVTNRVEAVTEGIRKGWLTL
jgi:DNA-binding NarL/FixJ family response regulator